MADRQRIVTALELPYVELEEYSFLYQVLDEMEDREDRLGIDILTDLRAKLDEIEALQVEIDAIKTANNGANNVGTVSKSVAGEYSYSVTTLGQGQMAGESVLLGTPLASLLSKKEDLMKTIHRMLNAYRRQESYPYGYYGHSTQSMILG